MNRKLLRLLTILLCLVLLAGCGNTALEGTPPEETSADHNSTKTNDTGYYVMEIPCNLNLDTWNPIAEKVTFIKEATPNYTISMPTPAEVWVNETQYVPLSYLWNRKDTQFTSGWKIQLAELYQVEIGAYAHIFSGDCDNPPVVLTYDQYLGGVALYFRPDIAEKGVAAFSYDEYQITENNSPYSNEEIRNFWNVHTGTGKYDFFTGLWLDASWSDMKTYCVMLEHKEDPALAYQMRFCIYKDILIIENINLKATVYVNWAELRP